LPRSNPIDQTRLAMAALSACLVDALGESEPAFQARFKENLEHAYNNIRDMEGSNVAAMEILHWTREFLKELQKHPRLSLVASAWPKVIGADSPFPRPLAIPETMSLPDLTEDEHAELGAQPHERFRSGLHRSTS